MGIHRDRPLRAIEHEGATSVTEPQVLALAVQVLDLLFERARQRGFVARQDCLLRCGTAMAIGNAELRVGLRDRAALFFIGLEQSRIRPAPNDRRELPGEVVNYRPLKVTASESS